MYPQQLTHKDDCGDSLWQRRLASDFGDSGLVRSDLCTVG